MSNSSYWQKRMMILEEASHKDAKACLREVLTAFTHSRIQLNSEIEKWISRIAANNELSMTEARKLLKGDELEEFHWNVEQYIEHGRANEIDHAWEKQLENASAKVHVSRWEAMNLSMEEYLREAFGKEEDLLEKLLEETAKERYTRTAYELEKGLNLGRAINVPATDIIVQNPWATDERIFSDRIWTHMTEMKAELQDALLQQVLTGAAPDEAIKRMQQYVTEGVDNAKRRASTLVMTEAAAIGNKAQMQCYKDLDVEELEIVATLDSITCKRCGSRDGLRYPESEMKIGLNAPPFHANCRCCTAPYIEGFEPSQRMMRNPKTGKSEYVENMTYEEWAERYLDDNRNDEGTHSLIASGARITDPYSEEGMKHADLYYKEIRKMKTDVERISKNTGMDREKIQAIKSYLFVDNSLYRDGTWKQFDPDCAIAQSWQRLMLGEDIKPHDMTLLNHELYEMQIKEENPGISHIDAHERAALRYNYGKEANAYYGNLAKH